MVVTPKQTKKYSIYKQNDWYSYYAGYSDEFVYEYVKDYVNKDITILDPWNGAGTTTLCCFLLGIKCYGIDLNPVMNVIAKAKLYYPTKEFGKKLDHALNADKDRNVFTDDPLKQWFSDDTVGIIRGVERNICDTFHIRKSKNNTAIDIDSLTFESAYALLLLFLSIRDYSAGFIGSNPTWIRSRNITKESIPEEKWNASIINHFRDTASKLSLTNTQLEPTIMVGNSRNILLPDNSIDVVLTSPPYCTRIDYAIYTQLELAVLGIHHEDVRKLRNNMIGSPTVHSDMQKRTVPIEMKLCNKVLNDINQHTSKAAQSYYYKTYKQYILEMEDSLHEISRVLSNKGIAILVVQDSWFKDIYVDVPGMVIEIAEQFGLKGTIQYNDVKQNMAYINTRSREYKKDKKAAEAIIVLRKVTHEYIR